ncbi:ATP-binding protein [Oculatella sp. FACHB-28]|nr:ATP-binding protein [Oculatella sp. FACHB-28]
MGDGVPNIVYLLTSLATSKNKLFLVEEPENDLHPKALKALLDLIIISSSFNQFVISTHSNIVVSYLCNTPESQLLRITSVPGKLPTESIVEKVASTLEARISVLQELGYSFSDFALWDGWLILEESSAERIIRDYLVPWFVPRLARVRTLAAGGIDKVEPILEDFQRLILFTHLQPIYKNRTWVRVDNDEPGKDIVSKLRTKYVDWSEDRFQTNDADQFEYYYPTVFAEKVKTVLSIQDRQEKRRAKGELLKEVMSWLDADVARGHDALEQSAASIIADLHTIDSQLSI